MSLDKSSLLYLRNAMKLIYQSNERDWMGVYITRNNPLTFHHIRKKLIALFVRVFELC